MINCRENRNELASKFNKLTDMEIEYLPEKAKDLNGTIPLELNKLKEKTTYVDKIYKILDEFNVKLDNKIRAKNEFSVRFNSIRQKEGTTG